MTLELLFPWKCTACGLPHQLKRDVKDPKCFKCGGELVRDDKPEPTPDRPN